MHRLLSQIENIYDNKVKIQQDQFETIFQDFIDELNAGNIRAAAWDGVNWKVNDWVKKGILLGFRFGKLADYSINKTFPYYDKHTYPVRPTNLGDHIRIVPGGTTIRTGSYVAAGVVIMPPAYINVGAYVDDDTMIDSHALVGSCAQIGKRVHLSAAAQIGGVLEPIGAMPVIVEDDVLIGGNCGVYEGTIIKRGSVLGAGTVLTRSIPVYDLASQKVYRGSKEVPLIIPENAVIVPGTRPITHSDFAIDNNLSLICAIIIKYRDKKTNAATALEQALR